MSGADATSAARSAEVAAALAAAGFADVAQRLAPDPAGDAAIARGERHA